MINTTIENKLISPLTATAHVATPKASRYLKALCNHFDRKAVASYQDNYGVIAFSFGKCHLQANNENLILHVGAETPDEFERVKNVMANHLIRFGNKEELQVNWV